MIQISTNLSIWLKFQPNLNSSPLKAFAKFFVQMPLLFCQKVFFKVFLTHYNSFVPELSNWSGAGLSVVDQKGLSWVSGLRILTQYCSGYWLNIIEDDEDIDSIFLRIVLGKLNFLRILKILRRLGMWKVYLKKKIISTYAFGWFCYFKA